MAKWEKPIKKMCSVTHKLKGTNVAVVRMLNCPAEMSCCYITINGKPSETRDFYRVRAAKTYAERKYY